MKKRILSMLLVLCMVVGMLSTGALAADGGHPFTDVSTSAWYADAVQYVYTHGLMEGTDTTTFSPNLTTSRGMLVTILWRLEGKPEAEAAAFTDVKADQWYTQAVAWAAAQEIVDGYGDGTFGPTDDLTREQFAVILYRYAKYKGYDVSATADLSGYGDADKVSSWAKTEMAWANATGMITGMSETELAPKGQAVRSQAAKILMTFCENVVPAETAKTVTVTLEPGNGKTASTVTVESGKTLAEPAAPTRSGYTFQGWYTAAQDGEKFDFATAITGDLTLYAQWEKESSGGSGGSGMVATYYKVTFEFEMGDDVAASVLQVCADSTAQMPTAPTRDGYTFEGWYTAPTGGELFDFDTAITGDVTVYAHWNTTEGGTGSYRITFDTNDGSGNIYQVQWVDFGETVSEPTAPTRELYRFTGWYLEPAAVSEYEFDTEVTSNLTLYAGWGNPDGSDDNLYAASNETETIFSVSDIHVDDENVTVTYNTNNVALMSVEFFTDNMEDGQWTDAKLNDNLSSTPITITSGYTEAYGELATITLPINYTLPEYYLVRATMSCEGSSTEYVTAQYTCTYAAFDAQTVDDFDEERVINFDGESDTNFGVIKESVIVIPYSCQYTSSGDLKVTDLEDDTDEDSDEPQMEDLVPEHLFTFPDKDSVISKNGDTAYHLSDLQVGDVIYIEGTTWMFKIKTIEVDSTTGSISFTQDKEVTMIDFYDTLKVDFEGLETDVSDSRLRGEVLDVDGSGSVTVGPFGLEKKFDSGVTLSGSISGKVTGNVKLLYDVKLFSEDYFEASFSFITEITGQAKAEVSTGSNTDNNHEWKNVVYQVDTRKIKLPTPVTGLDIYVKPSATIDWTLSAEVSFTWNSKQTSGFKYNSNTGRTDIKKKENTVSVMAKGTAVAKIGPIIDIGVELLDGILSGGVVAEAGAKLTAEAEAGADDLLNNTDSKHACGLCVSGEADWYVSAYVKCSYKITNYLKGDIVKVQLLDDTSPIKFGAISGRFFVSIINSADSPFHGNVKFGGGECTNKTYRIEIKTQDEQGHDIDGIQVSAMRQGQTSRKSGVSPYVVYLYDGTYTVSAPIDGSAVSKTVTVSGDRQTVVLSKSTTDTMLEATVADADTGLVLSGISVKISKGDVVVASAVTDSAGKFSVAVPDGSLTVSFTKEGYIPFSSTETVHENEATHSMGRVQLTPGSGMGGFHGTIRDAITNEPISGVTLNLYEGWNSSAASNTSLRTLHTDSNGEFRYNTTSLFGKVIGLASGNYTITASKEGYSDISYNIVVYSGTTDENPAINETMSPEMSDSYYRIVLTWGLDPQDLDSHLVAETDTEEEGIHVYYSDKNPVPCYANLDVDDTDSEGPETITITNLEGLSNIRYAVHDYTNRNENSSSSLSNSGAVVRLYKGNQLLRTFNVPTGYGGTEWDVFSLDSAGRITTINTMTYTTEPLAVLGGVVPYRMRSSEKDYELTEIADEAA